MFLRTHQVLQASSERLEQLERSKLEQILVEESQFENCASFGQASTECWRQILSIVPTRRVQPLVIDALKAERKALAYWIRANFRKEQIMRILFSDEKNFNIAGVDNLQNDRVWALSRSEANEKGRIFKKRKFLQELKVWLGTRSKGISPLVIFEESALDHAWYIKEVVPMAFKYGNKVFGSDWTLQRDRVTVHIHQLTEQWCQDRFPPFIDKGRRPPKNLDLNPLNYSI